MFQVMFQVEIVARFSPSKSNLNGLTAHSTIKRILLDSSQVRNIVDNRQVSKRGRIFESEKPKKCEKNYGRMFRCSMCQLLQLVITICEVGGSRHCQDFSQALCSATRDSRIFQDVAEQ